MLLLQGCGTARLRYHLKVGTQVNYRTKTAVNFEFRSEEMENPVAGVASLEQRTALKVERHDRTATLLSYSSQHLDENMTILGEPMRLGHGGQSAATLVLDERKGKLVDVRSGDSDQGQVMGLTDMLQRLLTQLPDSGYARVGQSWETDLAVPVPGADGFTYTAKWMTTFAAIESYDGIRVARLESKTQGPLRFVMQRTPSSGTATLTATTLVDMQTGLPVSQTAQGTVTWSAPWQINERTIPVQMTATVKLDTSKATA